MLRTTCVFSFLFLSSLLFNETIEATPQLLNDRTRDMIGASIVSIPEMISKRGITGEGEVVAIADSGLDKGRLDDLHPDFESLTGKKPKIILIKSWADGPTADLNGHGTHMAGIVGGKGTASDGKYIGMAPGSSLYIQALMNKNYRLSPPEDLHNLFFPAYNAAAYIHVNGWGTPGNKYNKYAMQIDSFMNQYPDFLAIFGAGNGGPGKETLTSEANSKNALVIGASFGPRPNLADEDHKRLWKADFSSAGPTADGRIKPDLIAPGTSVISTASRAESNSSEYPYKKLQGTSMSAAVAGGAAALLRQYLREDGYNYPSSALLKASLINGAYFPTELAELKNATNTYEVGFGILDVARSILALREKTFKAIDNVIGIKQDSYQRYVVTARSQDVPLKVTLVWTDPSGKSGKLVNDLDLKITSPDGKVYMGNEHLDVQAPDRVNNVEQVLILKPIVGEYVVEVSANRVVSGFQNYALVMGQPLQEVFYRGEQEILDSLTKDYRHIKLGLDGVAKEIPVRNMPEGVLLHRGTTNIIGEIRQIKEYGIDLVAIGDKSVIYPTSRRKADEMWEMDSGVKMTVNGLEVREWPDDAKGATASLRLHPRSQKVVRVDAQYQLVAGYLDKWAEEKREIKLIKDNTTFSIQKGAGIDLLERRLGDAQIPGPIFGTDSYHNLLPGSKIQMTVDPASRKVNYIQVIRTVVQGQLENGFQKSKLQINGFGSLSYMEGIKVRRNGEETDIMGLQSGDYVQAVLIPDDDKAVSMYADSRVYWGKVLYVSKKERFVLFSDQYQRVHRKEIRSGAEVWRWGLPLDVSAIPLGGWGWISVGVDGKINSIRVLETGPVVRAKINAIDLNANQLVTDQSQKYRAFSMSAISYNGLPIPIGSLKPNTDVEIVPITERILDNQNADTLLAAVTINSSLNISPGKPALTFSALFLGKQFFVHGWTNASKIYIFPNEGNQKIDVEIRKDGQFVWWAYPNAYEKGYQLVAIHATGDITGKYIALPKESDYSIVDLKGHWAEDTVNSFFKRGILKGYPDKTFSPERAISRQELAVISARALGWSPVSLEYESLAESMKVASWAKEAYGIILEKKLFRDDQIEPTNPCLQRDVILIAERALRDEDTPLVYWPRWTELTFGKNVYQPDQLASRAFAATVLKETIHAIEIHQTKLRSNENLEQETGRH